MCWWQAHKIGRGEKIGTLANVAIIGAVLTIIGFSLIVGSGGTDSDAVVMVDRVGIVLAVGGIGLVATAGIGGAFRMAGEITKKSTRAGIAFIIVIAIVSGLVILMLFR